MFAILDQILYLHNNNYDCSHWTAVKRLLKNLLDTANYELMYVHHTPCI